MRIARRIRAARLEQARTVEDVETTAGFQKGLLLRFEEGKEVPSLKTLERLAEVLGVPVREFFLSDGEAVSTPRLLRRLTLEDLVTLAAFQAGRGRPN
ncbi:MAG TPA: helix-turn-helix domain-containing protein [Terriglobia bacterium]|nr:helix-turn-helix domain-containing protein [Terriglobia bacterium]